MRILIFGDSITHGFFDKEGGWAVRLVNQYHWDSYENRDKNGRWVESFNLGISGDKAGGVLKRFDAEVAARQIYPETNVIVIAIGTNDSWITDDKPVNDPHHYAEEISELIAKAKLITDRVLFVGMPSVDDKMCNDGWQYSSEKPATSNDRIWEFEQALRTTCAKQNVPLVKIFETFKARDEQQSLLSDGLHPNDAGHALIADLVKPEIEKLLQDS